MKNFMNSTIQVSMDNDFEYSYVGTNCLHGIRVPTTFSTTERGCGSIDNSQNGIISRGGTVDGGARQGDLFNTNAALTQIQVPNSVGRTGYFVSGSAEKLKNGCTSDISRNGGTITDIISPTVASEKKSGKQKVPIPASDSPTWYSSVEPEAHQEPDCLIPEWVISLRNPDIRLSETSKALAADPVARNFVNLRPQAPKSDNLSMSPSVNTENTATVKIEAQGQGPVIQAAPGLYNYTQLTSEMHQLVQPDTTSDSDNIVQGMNLLTQVVDQQKSEKKRKIPERYLEGTPVKLKREKMGGTNFVTHSQNLGQASVLDTDISKNTDGLLRRRSTKTSGTVQKAQKRGRPKQNSFKQRTKERIYKREIPTKRLRSGRKHITYYQKRRRAASIPIGVPRVGLKSRLQAVPRTILVNLIPDGRENTRRASSEDIPCHQPANQEAVDGNRRSAPPLSFWAKSMEQLLIAPSGEETELDEERHTRRAHTEGFYSAPPSPTHNIAGNSRTAGSPSCTGKQIQQNSATHVQSRIDIAKANAHKLAERSCDAAETDSGLSDALDVSDDDLENLEFSLPFVEGKLARASQRPRLMKVDIGIEFGEPQAAKGSSAPGKAATRKPPPPIYLAHMLDTRYVKEALTLIDGYWRVPKSCVVCLEARAFCNRGSPCRKCAGRGVECVRAPGWAYAKPKITKPPPKATVEIAPERLRPRVIKTHPTVKVEDIDYSLSSVSTIQPSSPEKTPTQTKKNRQRISKAVTNREDPECIWVEPPHPQSGKPLCTGAPEAWCTNRQELCESLPYFRSYQSGTYATGGVMRGYLLDGCAGPRDFINGRVVISHGGGKSIADENGARKLVANQLESGLSIRDLLNNLRGKWPLILIMGDRCSTSPSRIPHRYCVLGWFKVTAGWAEKDITTQHIRWMFRFEKLDSRSIGWWAASDELTNSKFDANNITEMVKLTCQGCVEESPQIYEQGWMCLRPQCMNFWKLGGEDPPTMLTYTESFINCRTHWPPELEVPPTSVRPPLSTDRDSYYDGGDVSRVYWKGMCCPQCGRLNCRELWAGWRCKACGYTCNPPRTIFEADRLADPHRPVFTGPALPFNLVDPAITWTREVKDGMTCLTYYLKDCGTVTHLLASEIHNKRPEGADWLFKEYQSPEMPFRRYPLKSHRVQGQLLTQQFSFNSGAPYKYIVAVDSVPFNQAPAAVSKSLGLLNERVQLVHPDVVFNEILSVGYFEGQKMDFHDDGEEELGETVASISLGSPAKMKFRVKARYASSYYLTNQAPSSPKKIKVEPTALGEAIDMDPVVGQDDEMKEEDAVDGDILREKKSNARVKLELRLNHGDIVIMRGREIQRIWEHAVTPIGLFRIAATARWINVPAPHSTVPQSLQVPKEEADKLAQIKAEELASVSVSKTSSISIQQTIYDRQTTPNKSMNAEKLVQITQTRPSFDSDFSGSAETEVESKSLICKTPTSMEASSIDAIANVENTSINVEGSLAKIECSKTNNETS